MDNKRPPAQVAAEGERLAEWLDLRAENASRDTEQDNFSRAAAFIREAYPMPPAVTEQKADYVPMKRHAGSFFVGVKTGRPIVRKISDPNGDAETIELFTTANDALERYHNVRQCELSVYIEPVRAPEHWGNRDDIE